MKNAKPVFCRNADSAAGFSLVEVSVAALLLVALVAGLYSAFATANRWVQPQASVAPLVARERIEQLYEYVRSDWWAQNGRPLSVGGPYGDGAHAYDGTTYTREYTVESVDAGGTAAEDYRRVRVRVTW